MRYIQLSFLASRAAFQGVIGRGLCPFAGPIRRKTQTGLRCKVSKATKIQELLLDVKLELDLIKRGLSCENEREKVEGSLLVVPGLARVPKDNTEGFDTTQPVFLSDFRSFVHASWEVQTVIQEYGLIGNVQVVLRKIRVHFAIYHINE
jgi:hypothetical protein